MSTTEKPSDHQRLEERITYCEHLADTLNGVVTDLQKRVSALELQNRTLIQELRQQRDASREMGIDSEKPPHY